MRERKIIGVDFDETLTIEKARWWKNERPKPNAKMIEKVNEKYKQGHVIIIFTARPWEVARETVAWLIENNVKFHGINCNKMAADIYVDDKMEDWFDEKDSM